MARSSSLRDLLLQNLRIPMMLLLTFINCFIWPTSGLNAHFFSTESITQSQRTKTELFSSPLVDPQETSSSNDEVAIHPPPLYLQEGVFAVKKPLGWTSQQAVGRIRWILEQDAKERAVPDLRTKRRKPWMKVGHGGTLDPLATGVLVVGIGKGTKKLQQYLTGSKGYRAGVELGFQTTTLDMDPKGEVVASRPFDHVTKDEIDGILPQFRGTIQQIPPIFSALKKDGKRLYELGRRGMTEDDVEIEAREVQIHRLELLWNDDEESLPSQFGLDVECGGGTYIRSLVRDIGVSLDTLATMTSLERTKQGVFLPEHCLPEENDWTAESIWNAIESSREMLAAACATEELET